MNAWFASRGHGRPDSTSTTLQVCCTLLHHLVTVVTGKKSQLAHDVQLYEHAGATTNSPVLWGWPQ